MLTILKKQILWICIAILCTIVASPCIAQTDTNSIKALFIKAMEYQDYNNDSAMILAQKGFNLSKKANYRAGLGMAFMRFGALMNIKGETDSALMYFREALIIRKSLNNNTGIAGQCQDSQRMEEHRLERVCLAAICLWRCRGGAVVRYPAEPVLQGGLHQRAGQGQPGHRCLVQYRLLR